MTKPKKKKTDKTVSDKSGASTVTKETTPVDTSSESRRSNVVEDEKNDLQPVSDIDDEPPIFALAFAVFMTSDLRLDDSFRRFISNPQDVEKHRTLIQKRFEKAAKRRGLNFDQYMEIIEKFMILLMQAWLNNAFSRPFL